MFFDWKTQLEEVQLTQDLKDDTLAKMAKGVAIQLYEHQQKMFDFLKTHVPHLK